VTARQEVERKYALTKIAAGDYLLLSNDGKTIWRIRIYEDGPAHGIEDWDRDLDFWGLWRWTERIGKGSVVDVEAWSRWEFFEGNYEKRSEAIDAALKLKGPAL
jgi:hypothetical protein